MKMRIPKQVYTAQFREAAVRQVIDAGRSASEVAGSLNISPKTLGNWVRRCTRLRESGPIRTEVGDRTAASTTGRHRKLSTVAHSACERGAARAPVDNLLPKCP